MPLLVIIAIVIAFLAVPLTSTAAAGPTVMAFACLLGIFGRIAQAGRQHSAVMRALKQREAPAPSEQNVGTLAGPL